MAGTLVKSVMLKITASDGDTEAKLDAISAKAKELADEHPDLKVRVDSAAAMAKLSVLRREMRDTANDVDGDSGSLKSRLMGLTGAVSSITGLGDAFAVANPEASMFQKVMAGASLATGLLEPALAGGIVAIAGLGAGVAAAGVGAGIFGLVAKQAFSAVSTNITAATKAYEQMATAQTKAQKTAALDAWKKSLDGLDQGQRTLVIDTAKAEVTWDNFVKSSTAGIAQTLAPALALLPKALSFASEFLGPVESALQDVILDVKQALDSPFWTSTISEWAATSGPMIEDIAVAIGHVIHGVAGILTTFMPMSTSLGAGLDSITEKFAKWGETLSSHSGFQSLMSMAQTEAPMAISVLKNLATVLLNVGKAMTGMDGVGNSKTLLQVLQPLSGVLASLSKNQDLDRIALYLLAATDAGKKLGSTFQGISNGLSLVKGGISNVSNLATGFKDADQAASDATGAWGTFGGAASAAMASVRTAVSSGLMFVSGLGEKIASAASSVGSFAASIGKAGASAALAGVQWAASAVKMVALKTAQLAVAAATKVWAGIQAAFNVIMDMNPIVLVTIAVIALVAAVVLAYTHFKTFRDAVNDVGRAIRTGFLDALHVAETGVSDAVNFVKSHWQLLVAIIGGPIAAAAILVIKYWSQIKSGISDAITFCENVIKTGFNAAESVVNSVTSAIRSEINTQVNAVKTILNWFSDLGTLFSGWWNKGLSATESVASSMVSFVRGIPSKILSALGNMGSLLYSAGQNVIKGLISGISSMVSSVSSTMSGIVSDIRSMLPFSPAKKGPLSGTGSPDIAGRKIGQMLAAGLESSTSTVAASAHKVAGAATITASGGLAGAGAAGGGQLSVSFQGASDQNLTNALLLALRKQVRVSYGGNVQAALGH